MVMRLMDKIFSIHINATADNALALFEGKSSRNLTTRSPVGEVFLGLTVPHYVGRLRLRLNAIPRRVDGHIRNKLSHKAGVLVQIP